MDPNQQNQSGQTALSFALQTDNQEIINKLCKVTTENLDSCIKLLAQNKGLKIENNNELEKFAKRLIQDRKQSLMLEKGSFFGNSNFLKFLFNNTNNEWQNKEVQDALKNAVIADDPDCVKLIRDFWQNKTSVVILNDERKKKALRRGNSEILNILDISFKKETIFKIPNFPLDLNLIPKSVEFDYTDVMEKIKNILDKTPRNDNSQRLVTYQTLLDELHVGPVHYKKEEVKDCNDLCPQKTCGQIRAVINLLDQIMNKIAEKFPIFNGFQQIVVGSLKEQTKIGKIDESDVTLVLDPKYQKYLEFDEKNQNIRIMKIIWDEQENKSTELVLPDDLPEELKLFVVKDGSSYLINTQKYFYLFVEEFFKIIESGDLELPEGLFPLSTKFRPCQVCENTSHIITRFVRCRHDQDCQEHKKRLTDPGYEETCVCANFTSPCLSLSKIGLVLHLMFVDGEERFPIDVDVSPPSFAMTHVKASPWHRNEPELIPQFNGSIVDKRKNLEKTRPYLWYTEWEKTEDMSDAASEGDGLRRAVRLRNHNGVDVLAEQVTNQKIINDE